MVTIKKGELNTVGFSVSELSNCGEPFEYRFELVSEDSEAITFSFVKTPINASSRLQIFEIDEPTDVAFQVEGYYSYSIYQTTSNNLVEIGLLRVVGDEETPQTVTDSTNPQVYGN